MIKTIIFDFGDVFINLDKAAPQKKLHSLGLKAFHKEMFEFNEAYEKGELSTENFLEYYSQLLPKVSRKDLINAWNSMILNIPKHRMEFLQRLRDENQYQLFLLSNTNEMHIGHIKTKEPFYESFKECFDKFYLSYEMGLIKPDPKIFEYILKDNDLVPEECFFIDDTSVNTQMAEQLGIHIWNINPADEDITELFDKYQTIF